MIFNDPVHGTFELPSACVAIIDTPQFQRLRFIKQLGLCYFVYPGASHNRFEHSLGVCHLAGELVSTIKGKQEDLDITDKDILCVQIAGLCHDLGHGPFSHIFDGSFLPRVRPDRHWKHEEMSRVMFDFLVEKNKLMKDGGALKASQLTEEDITFIKDLIHSPNRGTQPWPYRERPVEKSFLFEVVANKRSGIDVDKWDYFARDCLHLGISNNFNHSRFVKLARVIRTGEEWQICYRDKIGNIYNMFYTRYSLHRAAYKHRVTCALDLMLTDALVKANDHLFFGENRYMKMSECVDDPEAFSQLNDNVMFKILESNSEELADARRILQRIFVRNLYRCVAQSEPFSGIQGMSKEKLKPSIVRSEVLQEAMKDDITIKEEDFLIQIPVWNFGMKATDPVNSVKLYRKDYPDEPQPACEFVNEVGPILRPKSVQEMEIRVYTRTNDNPRLSDILKKSLKSWCESKEFTH